MDSKEIMRCLLDLKSAAAQLEVALEEFKENIKCLEAYYWKEINKKP